MRELRSIAAVVLAILVACQFSCVVTDVDKVRPGDLTRVMSGPGFRDIAVLEIVTKSGVRKEFSDLLPGRIEGSRVIGLAPDKVDIPLEDIDWMWARVRRVDGKRTTLAVVGVAGFAAVATLFTVVALSDPSCPYIYSYDGKEFVYDAEPYAGSAVKGAQRAELWTLEHVKADGGEYRILVANPAPETEYIDELRLLAVDHPAGVEVIPGALTSLYTVADPVPASRAIDAKGRDLTDLFRRLDRSFWQSREEGRDPGDARTLRDELVFEFAKPRGAARAKLLFNGNSTAWGPESIRRYLALYGDRAGSFYDGSGSAGRDLSALLSMHFREEFFALKVWVETPAGWQNRGLLAGGPPLIAQTRAVPLDVSDIPGDVVRIRLGPPAPYWKIDYVAMDFSADRPLKITEIEPVRATDGCGPDAAARLARTDGDYLVITEHGDPVEAAFPAPPLTPGLDRTVILKAGGYYEPSLHAGGRPQTELLDRLHREPGFAARYFYDQYLEWKENRLAILRGRPEAPAR